MSNLTCASGEASTVSSSNNRNENGGIYFPPMNSQPQPLLKKKRNQPGHPDPGAEVIALSPKSLLATNRFVCEICNKGFQRDQNLQLHRRGHNLPWKLKQRTSMEVRKKVYVCPETSCVHHDPSRALGDLTGIKKHFCRKHGEKKWKCEKCSKKYAVQSDWKAHSKTCGTREYRCDCGTLFSRRDSFITHRAFCDALAEESARSITGTNTIPLQAALSHHDDEQQMMNLQQSQFIQNGNHGLPIFPIKKEQQSFSLIRPAEIPPWLACPPTPIGPQPIDLASSTAPALSSSSSLFQLDFQQQNQDDGDFSQNPNPSSSSLGPSTIPPYHPLPHISATALLQKAAQMGAKSSPSPAGVFSRPHQAHLSAGSHSATTTGFGLNLSSRDEFFNGMASSYGNKAAAAPVTGAGGTTTSTNNPSLLHDMMMNNPGFEGSGFEDMTFGGILNQTSKKDDEEISLNFHAALDEQFSIRNGNNITSGGNENSDGMTRDFLGLRPLSQSDINGWFKQLREQ